MHYYHKLKNQISGLDRKQFFSSFSSLLTHHGFSILIALATSYFFANYLEKGVFGTYQFVLTIYAVMSVFTLKGVGKQIIKIYVQTGRMVLVPKTLQLALYSLPVAFLNLFTAGYFYIKENPELAISLVIVSVFFPIIISLNLYGTALHAKEKYKKLAILGVIQSAVPAGAMILAITQGFDLSELILTFVLSHTLTLVALYTFTIMTEKIKISEREKRTSAELHLSISHSILEAGKLVDRLVVFSFLGPTQFAIYMMALLPVRELMSLPQIIKLLVLPKFSKYKFHEVRGKAYEKTLLLFIMFSVISILYILSAPIIFKLLFPLYIDSVFYTQLISLVLPLGSSVIFTEMFMVFDKTRELYIVNTTFTIFNLVLTIIFCLWLGILGVIIAKLISNSSKLLSLIFLSHRISH